MASSINSVGMESSEYPGSLIEIPNPPKIIFYRGVLPIKDEIMVAIVGTRKATRDGRESAREIARNLSDENITIVSGLALGIDGAAHEGALRGNAKRTIAVLGNGLQEIYPRTHERLGKEILESGGALISEYQEGAPALPHHFLLRNRIVSGLSRAVIVIEAPMRSGSLVTAKCALEQGKEVFVLPGPANHPNYKGSHYLIRNGARLIQDANDVLEDLGIAAEKTQETLDSFSQNRAKDFDETTRVVLKVISESKGNLSLDDILEKCDLLPHVVAQKISILILKNIIEEKAGTFRVKP